MNSVFIKLYFLVLLYWLVWIKNNFKCFFVSSGSLIVYLIIKNLPPNTMKKNPISQDNWSDFNWSVSVWERLLFSLWSKYRRHQTLVNQTRITADTRNGACCFSVKFVYLYKYDILFSIKHIYWQITIAISNILNKYDYAVKSKTYIQYKYCNIPIKIWASECRLH